MPIRDCKLLLTYKTHINKDKMYDFMSSKKYGLKNCWIAHETGENKDYPHSHVFVVFDRRVNLVDDTKVFDYEGIHPNIQLCKNSNEDSIRILKYMCKEDEEMQKICEDMNLLEPEVSLAEGVWNCKSLTEALRKYVKKPADAVGVRALWDSWNPADAMTITLRQWQQELYDELQGPVDDRKVIWFNDEKGNTGKTTFAKYMASKSALVISGAHSMRDIATLIEGHLRHYPRFTTCIINLTRTEEDKEYVYKMIEQIKDGLITASKYQSKTVTFNSPHVVVFANWPPRRETLSYDRWDIRSHIRVFDDNYDKNN